MTARLRRFLGRGYADPRRSPAGKLLDGSVDLRGAVLLDEASSARLIPPDENHPDPLAAVEVSGRIFRTEQRVSHLYVMSPEGVALLAEVISTAGQDMVELVQAARQ